MGMTLSSDNFEDPHKTMTFGSNAGLHLDSHYTATLSVIMGENSFVIITPRRILAYVRSASQNV